MHTINFHELVATSRFNRLHRKVLLWCLLIMIVDGYELTVVGAALPAIMSDMKISATSAGFMAGSALFGSMVGAMFIGTLSDRIGRVRMSAICIALFTLFTAATGLTSDPISFSILRFIAGLGTGGIVPIMTSQMSEFAPLNLRSRLVTIIFAGSALGAILVALTAKVLVVAYGWQWLFFVGALPIVMIPFLLKTMPESPSFLIRNNRERELRAIAQQLDPHLMLDEHIKISGVSVAQVKPHTPVRGLFQEGRGLSTLMIWIAFMTGLFMAYALSSWLTKLMGMAGYTLGSALNFVIIISFGSIVGAIVGGWLADKFNIKYVMIGFYLFAALMLILLGHTRSTNLHSVVVFLVGASALGSQLLAYAYAGDYYPASLRATGVGFASSVGRIGAIGAPMVIGLLISLELTFEHNFMAVALAGLVGGVAVMFVDQTRADSTLVKQALATSQDSILTERTQAQRNPAEPSATQI